MVGELIWAGFAQVGSPGPCTIVGAECLMSGEAKNGGVEVTYSYKYGCTNKFTIAFTPGPPGTPLGQGRRARAVPTPYGESSTATYE